MPGPNDVMCEMYGIQFFLHRHRSEKGQFHVKLDSKDQRTWGQYVNINYQLYSGQRLGGHYNKLNQLANTFFEYDYANKGRMAEDVLNAADRVASQRGIGMEPNLDFGAARNIPTSGREASSTRW